MASLNFTITATQAEFNDFADRLGYMTMVFDETDTAVPNPETRQEFLQRVLKEKVAGTFYTPFVEDIARQELNTREAEKEAMRNVVRDRVAVSFSA